jgi:pimeloyl-ACP methyl ester carboxylesterase
VSPLKITWGSALAALGLVACASGQANLPPAATASTQPPPMPPARTPPPVPEAVDPEAKEFPYPYPVQFLELNSQGQRLRMAYLDVPAAWEGGPAKVAEPPPTTTPPPAAEPAQPPPTAAAPTTGPTAAAGAVEQPANPGEPPAGQAQGPAADSGRCIVLLHGKNFSAAAWGQTIDMLSKQGMRVIAPDQIGFGKSSKPSNYQYSFAQLAHNTRELLDKLKLTRCSVVGHSMGGMLGVRFALLYPAATERLILVNPIGLEDYAVFVQYRTVDEWYTDELKQTPETIREYQRTSYYNGQWKPAYEEQIQLSAGFTRHPDYTRVAWASALTYDMIFTQPMINDLPRLRVPTRLIIGLRDRTALGRKFALPKSAAAMGDYAQLGKKARDLIPGAQLIELAGVGHVPQVEAFPAFRDALLQFLR